ncbi:hypothetical protein RQN30_11185 [Arcanobacterium hippocoleae]
MIMVKFSFKKLSASLLVLGAIFVLSGCTQLPRDEEHNDEASSLSPTALKQYVAEQWDVTQFLAQASFRADKHLDLKPGKEKSFYRQIAFACAQDSPSPVSIWLRHGSEMRRLMELEACGSANSIQTVGLSSTLFPQAEQAVFIAKDDTRITTIIFETTQEKPFGCVKFC